MKVKTEKPLSAIEFSEPTSLKDAGYKLARIGESIRSIAMYMLQYPEFVSEPVVNSHKEIRNDLAEGYKLRFHEKQGQDYYIVSKDTGAWLKLTNSLDADHAEKFEAARKEKREVQIVSVYVASGISQQEFGRLAKDDPEQHKVVKEWRTKWRGYESNKNKDLESAVRDILREQSGEKKTRTTLNFIESANKVFDAWDKSVKVKQNKGDETADPVRFRTARAAFWKAYNA